LSGGELTLAYALGGVTRGLVVGVVVSAAIWCFVPLHIVDLGAVIFYAVAASLLLSLLGVLAGIWAEKFDHMAAVTNFIVTPLSFLSGTFYSVDRLPEGWRFVAHLNPFFYMIDGFRYGFFGVSDVSPWTSLAICGATCIVLVTAALRLLASGYKTRH
jgi:ABC-2 type transport system permease protein